MWASPADRNEIKAKIQELRNAADNVHDEASLAQYFATHNSIESNFHNAEVEGLVEPNRNAERFGKLYIILYAIGTCATLIGQGLE